MAFGGGGSGGDVAVNQSLQMSRRTAEKSMLLLFGNNEDMIDG